MKYLTLMTDAATIIERLLIRRRVDPIYGLLILLAFTGMPHPLSAQEVFIGEIDLVPYNFAMRGYADCSGQILSISQNTALFSLLGTMYGGNGTTTFALPNLNNRLPIHSGQGPGLSNYTQGQTGGEASHTLTISEIPSHTHSLAAFFGVGTSVIPSGQFLASNAEGTSMYHGSANAVMGVNAIGSSGGGQPHNNLQPFLGLKYVIALQGIYPQRP